MEIWSVIGIRNSDYLYHFGAHLKKIRLSRKMTQESLAFNADIAISQIGRLERGEGNVTISTIFFTDARTGISRISGDSTASSSTRP